MRSPAYKRRQERRLAARVAAEQAAEVKEEDANESRKVEEDAVKLDFCNGSESIVTDQVMDQVEIISKETGKSTCIKCSFESNWENGLDVHKKTAHVLKMQKDNSLNEKYENTSHYWKTGHLGTVYQRFLVDEVIDGLDAPEQWKICEKDKILEARRSPLVQDAGEIFHLGQDEFGYLLPILHTFTEPVNVFEI